MRVAHFGDSGDERKSLEWKAGRHESGNDERQVSILFRCCVQAGEALGAEFLFDHRFPSLVSDEVRNRAAERRSAGRHEGVHDGPAGIDGDVVGDHGIKRDAEERSVNEGDDEDSPDAPERGERSHNPRFVAHEKMFESLHHICCLRWLRRKGDGLPGRPRQSCAWNISRLYQDGQGSGEARLTYNLRCMTTHESPALRAETLREIIRHHEHLYFVLDTPEITDAEFDAW